jgi:hypothetical protein
MISISDDLIKVDENNFVCVGFLIDMLNSCSGTSYKIIEKVGNKVIFEVSYPNGDVAIISSTYDEDVDNNDI